MSEAGKGGNKGAGNSRTGLKLLGVAVAMAAFGYALVPLYSVMCDVLDINRTGVTDKPGNTQVDYSRSITIEFDANTHDMAAWQFRPVRRSVTVHPGELAQAEFEVVNTRATKVTGQAIPSYGPSRATEYFKKIDCFCFTTQTMAANERKQMPVVFVVDPALPKDISTITLSYTFFNVEGTDGVVTKRQGI